MENLARSSTTPPEGARGFELSCGLEIWHVLGWRARLSIATDGRFPPHELGHVQRVPRCPMNLICLCAAYGTFSGMADSTDSHQDPPIIDGAATQWRRNWNLHPHAASATRVRDG